MARRLLGSRRTTAKATMSPLPYDEMALPDGSVRPHYRPFADWLARTSPERIAQKREEA